MAEYNSRSLAETRINSTAGRCWRAKACSTATWAWPAPSSSTRFMAEPQARGAARSTTRSVERPVVVEVIHAECPGAQLRLHVGAVAELRGIAREHVLDPRETLVAVLEVFAEPLEDLADLEATVAHAVARPVGQEALHAVFQLDFELGRNEGLGAQCGAADRGAVQRGMDARIHVQRTQLFVFEPVEVARFAEQAEKLLLPWGLHEGSQILDRFQVRVAGQ